MRDSRQSLRPRRVTLPDPGPPPPFRTLRARALGPLVLTCEHATRRIPLPLRLDPEERRIVNSHWGWDIGGWQLTRELSRRLAASAIGGRWSRLFIDLNRPADDPTLVRRSAEGVRLSWNQGLSAAAIEQRLVEYHMPYHTEVDRLIGRRMLRHVRPLLFAVHTFTPVFDGRTRGFDIGVLYEHHGTLARRLGRSLRQAGLRVRYNQPYSGMAGMMYSADRHGSHHRLPCLELEANQELFARQSSATRLAHAVAVGLREMLARLERTPR